VIFVQTGQVEAPYYIRVSLNFYPYFPRLLLDVGEIMHKNLHTVLVSICEFDENRPTEGRISLTWVSEITLMCTVKAYRDLKSQERREEYVCTSPQPLNLQTRYALWVIYLFIYFILFLVFEQ
jgi:hypothetical protein